MPNPSSIIGILGGMGPNASSEFLQRILALSSKRFSAVQDDEYPTIILNSIGLKGFSSEGILDKPMVEKQLINGVQKLEQAEADFIAIPCNTVLCCLDAMKQAVSIPILSIAECTAQEVDTNGYTRVGLCSSMSTIKTKLYESACRDRGITVVIPTCEEQNIINAVIETVMSGQYGDDELLQLKSVILNLSNRGAQAVILGCTELPLAINQKWTDVPLFDSLQILAQQTVMKTYKDTLYDACLDSRALFENASFWYAPLHVS